MDAREKFEQGVRNIRVATRALCDCFQDSLVACGIAFVSDAFNAVSAERDTLLAALHPEPLQGWCECGHCVYRTIGWDLLGVRPLPDDSYCPECGCLLDSGGVARPRPKAPGEGK